MASFEFNPLAHNISFKYICPNCKKECQSEQYSVPIPDFSAESHSDSVNCDYYDVTCEHCEHTLDLIISAGFYGGDGDINANEVYDVQEYFPGEDDEYFDKLFYDATHTDVEKTLDAINILPEDCRPFVYRLLYASVITSMESYLGDTLKREILKDDNSIRRFVETYKPFEKITFKLSDLFVKRDSLHSYIREVLGSMLYHDLRKIKPIFKTAVGIDLGNIGDIYKAVLIRHDIVHRNGKDKDGNEHKIREEDVRDISEKVKELIQNIENQLSSKEVSPSTLQPAIEITNCPNPFDTPFFE